MINLSEMKQMIKDYDYIKIKTQDVQSSYYLLEDNSTIIELKPNMVSTTLSGTKLNYDLQINSAVYAPASKRIPQTIPMPVSAKDIINNNVGFTPLAIEPTSTFTFENGLILKLRILLSVVQKTRVYAINGEPVYLVSTSQLINATPPRKV